ncbi:predicted protein [Lichtheimia corymbifera JMRC:FSU:9682]|uniref:F-box domain-containing protein n=1 Tax=Lichtheimia corymbifera JMRC:FSU:9682 TaxID=1263082 RepID=A0A068SFD3_9FUNG|nr:predicted protein [Lichtheimia corymbifera JMRC:FSU:9682]
MPPPVNVTPSRFGYNANRRQVSEPLHLLRLLDHCPTLVELKIATKETIFISSHHHGTYPSIRHLEIRYNSPTCENPLHPFNIKRHISPALFNHFPRLHLLVLWYPQPRYHDMQTIFQYCPMLQELFLGGIQNYSLADGTKTSQQGLRLLSLHSPSSQGLLISRLLKAHSTTLESLVMECVGPWTSPAGFMMNEHVVLPQLRSLELSFKGVVYEQPLTAFLCLISQRCPSLQKLTLKFHCFSFNIQWILPLARHGKLKKMVIASKVFPDNISTLLQHFNRLQAFDLKLKTIDRRGLLIDIPPSRLL